MPYVNIGYSIISLYQISSGTPTNQTEPTNSSTVVNRYFELPVEWTIGILGFAGTISAIIGVVLYKQKKKNVIEHYLFKILRALFTILSVFGSACNSKSIE